VSAAGGGTVWNGVPADSRLPDGTATWVGDLPFLAPGALAFGAGPPFSFNYDGKPSAGFLEGWAATRSSRRLDDFRTEHTLTHADPRTGLEVRCQAVEYNDFPTVEWTLYFENKGANDTPTLSEILPLDTRRDEYLGLRLAAGQGLTHLQRNCSRG
jgi:hypothetical protein